MRSNCSGSLEGDWGILPTLQIAVIQAPCMIYLNSSDEELRTVAVRPDVMTGTRVRGVKEYFQGGCIWEVVPPEIVTYAMLSSTLTQS